MEITWLKYKRVPGVVAHTLERQKQGGQEYGVMGEVLDLWPSRQEHQLSKHEDLSSNPQHPHKKIMCDPCAK